VTAVLSHNGQQLYVGHDQAVEVFTLDGQFVKRITFNSPNSAFVCGIAIDSATGNIFVATAFEVEMYSPDFAAHIKTFGDYGQAPGLFNNTRDMIFDREGRLLVADMANGRIQVFDASGNYITTFGTTGDDAGQFRNPTGLDIDGSGLIYVVDYHRVQIFDYAIGNNDKPVYTAVGTFGTLGTGNNQFRGSYDIALDWNGTIYVSDNQDHHVKAYTKTASSFINFTDHLSRTYGDEDFSISALTTDGRHSDFEKIDAPEYTGDVTLVPSGEGYVVKIVRAGRVKLRASAPDNRDYSRVNQDMLIDIGKASQEITFSELAPRIFGEVPFSPVASASSGLPVTFETSNPLIASATGNTVTLKSPGTVTIIAQQTGNENYLAASPVEQSLEISAITGTIYEEHNSVRIYPVPAQDVLTIRAAFASDVTPVTVCDAHGRTVRQITPEVIDAQTRRLSLAGLNPGLYLLKLNDSNNTTKRLIKN